MRALHIPRRGFIQNARTAKPAELPDADQSTAQPEEQATAPEQATERVAGEPEAGDAEPGDEESTED